MNDRDPSHHSPFKWSYAKVHAPFIPLTSSAFRYPLILGSLLRYVYLTPGAFSFPILIVSTLHTPNPIFLHQSHISPWHHYQPTSPYPSSVRMAQQQPTLRRPQSLLSHSQPIPTRHPHSPKTLYHPLIRLGTQPDFLMIKPHI